MAKKKSHGSTKHAKAKPLKPSTPTLSPTTTGTALKQQSPNQLNLPSVLAPRTRSKSSSTQNEKPHHHHVHTAVGAGEKKDKGDGVVIEAQDSPVPPAETAIYPSPPKLASAPPLPPSPPIGTTTKNPVTGVKKLGYLSTLTNAIVKPLSTSSSSLSATPKPSSATPPPASSTSSSAKPSPPEREREERRGRSRRPRILWRSEIDEPTWYGLEECWARLCVDEEKKGEMPRLEWDEKREGRVSSREGKRWSDELDKVGM